jgi:hypothetical protein
MLSAVAFGWAVLIFYLLSSPNPPSPGSGFTWLPSWLVPTVGHLFLFAVLAGLLSIVAITNATHGRKQVISISIVVVITAAYGGAMELYQGAIPERSASWVDTLVDTAGSIAGTVAVRGFANIVRSRVSRAVEHAGLFGGQWWPRSKNQAS